MSSLFLKKTEVHQSWAKFLDKDTTSLIFKIEKEVTKKEFTPPADKVLRFLEVPLDKIKIIILGQDPYPQPGIATGRAFEVGTLKSWNEPFKNISLKNILRAVYRAYTGETVKFSELKQKLDNEFPVLPPNKFFSHWEREGVLMINTAYTCETGKPGSHKKEWEEFTHHVLQFLQKHRKKATWFLWGSHAKQATENIDLKNVIETHHPMMCYDKPGRDKDFLYGKINCFGEFIPEIDWTGYDLQKGLKKANKLFY